MTGTTSDNGFNLKKSVDQLLKGISEFYKYPILSVWLMVFTFLLLIIDSLCNFALRNTLSLYPGALFKFDMNRLSFYPLLHVGLIHWALNVVSLFPLISDFERKNGTVHTGVTINLLAVVAGLQYCIFGSILFPNTKVIGLLGYVFLFITYYAFKEHTTTPEHVVQIVGRQIRIQTIHIPFIILAITFILMPGSSLWGHLTAISAGFCLSRPEFKKLYPPSKVILFIEKKIGFLIEKLARFGVWYPEAEAIEARGITYIPMFTNDNNVAETV